DGPQLPDVDVEPDDDTNLDDEEVPLIGRAFPVSIALLGLAFTACALLVAGLPPLSGFVAKVALMSSALQSEPSGDVGGVVPSSAAWWIVGLLLASGMAATISLSRTGIRHFWAPGKRHAPRMKLVEALSVLTLIFSCVLLTWCAEPVLRYTNATAVSLHAPRGYIDAVLSLKPRPGPTRFSGEQEGRP
ncbi:MAG TPA: cation:proton antiporter, partial [Polyangiaceae bacterium]|nr:cation:proton antiporter [Polyangiaceae bacterium]